MPNVKPGDLCLVVGTSATPGLNGKIVEVIALAQHLQVFRSVYNRSHVFSIHLSRYEKTWEVRSAGALPWGLNSGEIAQMQSRPVGDEFLVKIKDGDLTLDEETEISNNTSKTKEKENQC